MISEETRERGAINCRVIHVRVDPTGECCLQRRIQQGRSSGSKNCSIVVKDR